jgi:DAK2 domain fusion protein YloV
MKTLNGQSLKQLLLSGANNLYNHYPEIDQLNVFPVPDGDTGMNMNLTMTSGSKEIQNKNDADIHEIAQAFSKGSLNGSRGNSGVITSQIFRGFADYLKGRKSIGAVDLAKAFVNGKEVAYKAVMHPVEGTILTVIRESSEALLSKVEKDWTIEKALDTLLSEAKKSLKHTPDLLPILKEVGVVDSGGAGLCVVIEGMAKAAHGKFVARTDVVADASRNIEPSSLFGNASPYAGAKVEDDESWGYCTQFVLRLGKPDDGKKPFIAERFQNFLNNHGRSVVFARDDDIVKVHVHTLNPGSMLNYAQNYGEFVSITIENMFEEHDNIAHGHNALDMEGNIERKREHHNDIPLSDYAIVAVSSGAGLDEAFKELGVSVIVPGGQTMNPSTEDFGNAIKKAHAKHVLILPNNSNIIMAASQACDLAKHDLEGVEAVVIPSKSIPQGISAIMQFNDELSFEEIVSSMNEGLSAVRSGSVTYAIKDSDIEGVHITKGYYMAMRDDKAIAACVPDRGKALVELIKSIADEDSSIVTVFYGEDVDEDEAKKLIRRIQRAAPNAEIDMRSGGQPVYSFIAGIE